MIGKPLREARAIYDQYDRKLPFVSRSPTSASKRPNGSATPSSTTARAGTGIIGKRRQSSQGRRPVLARGSASAAAATPSILGIGRWLRRAETHTALNALIQGSAARHTKLWMRACWREGIVPLLQMHDALECSVATREQAELVAQLGCEAVTLEVPMQVDLKFGRTWGDAKHTWEELTGTAPAPKQEPVVAAKPQPTAPGINGDEGSRRRCAGTDRAPAKA